MNTDFYDEARDGMSSLLHNVVYCSRAAPGVTAQDIDAIIATARRFNAAHGITGLLVFGSDVFFQWLEGPKASILELMARIHRDTRHNTVVELSVNEEVRERVFPTWDMELVQPDDIREVLQDALRDARAAVNAKALRELIQRVDQAGLS
jgi:hypothetical protein